MESGRERRVPLLGATSLPPAGPLRGRPKLRQPLRRQIVERFARQGHHRRRRSKSSCSRTRRSKETHYKKQVLAELERESPPKLLVVGASPKRRPGTRLPSRP